MIRIRNIFILLTILIKLLDTAFAKEIDIDISSYDPKNEKTHVFHVLVDNFTDDLTQINVKSNATHLSGLYIVQAHSYRYKVTLLDSEDSTQNQTGYNVGVAHVFQDCFKNIFFLEKLSNTTIKVLIAVTVFEDGAPIPGGCPKTNENFKDINPSLTVTGGSNIIRLESQEASIRYFTCSESNREIQVEIYHKYLPSQNFQPYHYFDGILSMLNVKDVRNLDGGSRLVSSSKGSDSYKKLFSSYIGVGEVFVVLITLNGRTSAYVPAVSYGEDINLLIERQEIGQQGIFVTLFSILPFVSLLIICKGHAFFHFTTFSLGLSCGTIVSFFILNNDGAATVDDKLLWSILIGILYGVIWVLIWYKCGIPLLSATLAFLHAGSLIVSIIYHCGLADLEVFHYNGIYWSVFFGIMFICWFVLAIFTMHGHIFSCAFLGSYIFMITTLNYWMGGNLQYIVINVYRRIFIQDFSEAFLDPPYQPRDFFIVLCGLLLLLRGYYVQVKNQRGKPPFPPHCSHRFDDERSPLLHHDV